MVKIKKITDRINSIFKYLYLKNISPNKYESFLKKEYRKRTGEELNISNPQKYTEKMQYAKLYCNTALKTNLTDKYLVRGWVSKKIGHEYLIPLLGVWDNYSEIDFDNLPNQFVLKTNHSSGWNLIVKNKKIINHSRERKKFNRWIGTNFAFYGDLQLHYKNIVPKIIAEEYIEDTNGELNDFRFICFNGKAKFCWIDIKGSNYHYSNIYDTKWQLQPWELGGLSNTPYEVNKPNNFQEMVSIANKLASEFDHVRVDLYNVDGKIYFGEMTFTSTGGYRLITPEHYNYAIGNLWNLYN